MQAEQTASIEVPGGQLHYALWGEAGPLVLAAHGLTANHVSFYPLAREMAGRFRLIAPDHRGRGRSRDIRGPWGMREHARDVMALLDALGIDNVDLMLGHSMGGFIAAVAGAMAPERIPRILMVDGGLPLVEALPKGMSLEQLLNAIIGPSMERLEMSFDSRAAYRDYWRDHPALKEDWSADIEAYLDYDLVGKSPPLYPATRREAIFGDVETQLVGDTIPAALRALQMPVRLLRAEGGIMDATPLYSDAIVDRWAPQIADFRCIDIPGVNHFTILQSPRGSRAVVAQIEAMLAPQKSHRRRTE